MLVKKLKNFRYKIYQFFEDQITNVVAPLVPLDFMEERIAPSIIAPFYHLISDERVEHVVHLTPYRNTQQFKADLDFFLMKYQPIELGELLKTLNAGRQLPKRAFLLSFDDGFREAHDVISPILKEKGVPAIFFLTTAFLDNQTLGYRQRVSILAERLEKLDHHHPQVTEKIAAILRRNGADRRWVRRRLLSRETLDRETLDDIASVLCVDFDEYLSDVRPYLTTEQVHGLLQDGFHIGAHSVDHTPYRVLSLADQLNQTLQSMAYVKEKFGLDYSVFAFPFSDTGISARFFEALDGQVDLFFGTSAFRRDPIDKIVHRFRMERPRNSGQEILNRLYVRNQVRKSFGVNFNKR